MKYVYILKSFVSEHFMLAWLTTCAHGWQNAGEVTHTAKHKSGQVKTYLAFSDDEQAFAFERDLKSASGRAFAKKRL